MPAQKTHQTDKKIKPNESGQLKEFSTPPHNLAIEQAVWRI